MDKIRIGICGYGNLGKGVESEITKNPDMELVAVFSRRNPVESLEIKANVPVVHISDAAEWKEKIDVLILCGGSKSDLPAQGPEFAKSFNTVDSFDTHAKIPEYFITVDDAAKAGDHLSIISAGWDPGLFSIQRLYMGAILPEGRTYTFWGPGVSQGHSEAIRGIKGVKDAIQYTIPNEKALEQIRSGETPELTTGEKHKRLCYVVCEENADKEKIENEIKTMPNYFADYETTVNYISQEELKENHSKMMHGGYVMHTAETGRGNKQGIEFNLKLDSNPEFTSSVLVACARAVYKLAKKGERGAITMFDIPPAMLSQKSPEELRKNLL